MKKKCYEIKWKKSIITFSKNIFNNSFFFFFWGGGGAVISHIEGNRIERKELV